MSVPAFVLLVCAVLFGPAGPLRAGTAFDFLFSLDKVTNDGQYFLNLAVSNYGYTRPVLEPLLPRVPNLQADLPVAFFLADHSGRPLDDVISLRARGASWTAIFTSLRVPQDLLFAGFDQDPGPPYGHAWGYWKQTRHARLSDQDICGLVQVQLASRWVGAAPLEVSRQWQRGETAPAYVAARKGRPYRGRSGHGPEGGERGGPPGHGHGHDQGHKPNSGHGHEPGRGQTPADGHDRPDRH